MNLQRAAPERTEKHGTQEPSEEQAVGTSGREAPRSRGRVGPPGSRESPGVRRAALHRRTLPTSAAKPPEPPAPSPANAGPGKTWGAARTRSGGDALSRGDPPPVPQPKPPFRMAELGPLRYLLAIALPGSTIGGEARAEVSGSGRATRHGAGQSRGAEPRQSRAQEGMVP